jgi:hypothetical protein
MKFVRGAEKDHKKTVQEKIRTDNFPITSVDRYLYRNPSNTIFFYLLVGWNFRYCGHNWPIVPASGDNEDDYAEADRM